MRRNLILASVVVGIALVGSPVRAADLRVRVGEKRLLSVRKAQGLSLDNPGIADARIVGGTQVEVVGKGNGIGKLLIFTADGKTQTFSIQVTGGSLDVGELEDAANEAWPVPRFGGKKNFPNAVKLSVYSHTPLWLAGIFLLVPGLSFLLILGLYGFYLLRVGLPLLMGVPEDRALRYAMTVTACALIPAVVLAIV